jgi:hypothetical protein
MIYLLIFNKIIRLAIKIIQLAQIYQDYKKHKIASQQINAFLELSAILFIIMDYIKCV